MIEASAMFSAFEGSLRSLLDFLFSLKLCVPTAAVSLSALAYKLLHELLFLICAVSRGSRTLAQLWSAFRCWLAWIGCSVVEGGILLSNALRTLPKPRKVEADCKLLHLCVCALV